MSIVEL